MTMPKEGLLATDAEAELTSEQLYADEPDPPENMQELFRNGMIGATAGCGASEEPGAGTGEDPSPQKQNTDGDGDGEPKSDSSLRRQWREVAAQAQLQSRDHGDLAGQILADLLDVPPPKVRWEQVLRGAVSRATTEAGVDDVSWSRRSRRSTPQIILPGGVTRKCRVAVVIDTSGSMSDDQLARCVSETTAIVNNTGIPIFLVVHDVEVHADCWIHPGNRGSVHKKINSKMIGRGGTDFDDAYNRVANERGRFSAMVHLTDGGVGEWPQRPSNVRRLVVALIATDAEHVTDLAPADARIIEVEL
jgi:predicted metal-dependent peptidase